MWDKKIRENQKYQGHQNPWYSYHAAERTYIHYTHLHHFGHKIGTVLDCKSITEYMSLMPCSLNY